jgi:hypothetical protein
LSLKFSKIDPLSFSDHASLAPDDVCYHLGEYTARRGYSFSPTNQLIINLKKKPSESNSNELYYKSVAISTIAWKFTEILTSEANKAKLKAATLVPVPPSANPGDPLHDDRMMRVLNGMGAGLTLDIRELVKQHHSVPPAHECESRPSIADLMANYYIDETRAEPEPKFIWIFDDVLTAGNHYKAMQGILQQRYPGIRTSGFFVARRVPEPEDLSAFLSFE